MSLGLNTQVFDELIINFLGLMHMANRLACLIEYSEQLLLVSSLSQKTSTTSTEPECLYFENRIIERGLTEDRK